jgi:hypothetical protein
VVCGVFELPSLRNTRKCYKTKKVEEKLTSKILSICLEKVFDMDFLHSPCRLAEKRPKMYYVLTQKPRKKKSDGGWVGLGFSRCTGRGGGWVTQAAGSSVPLAEMPLFGATTAVSQEICNSLSHGFTRRTSLRSTASSATTAAASNLNSSLSGAKCPWSRRSSSPPLPSTCLVLGDQHAGCPWHPSSRPGAAQHPPPPGQLLLATCPQQNQPADGFPYTCGLLLGHT